MMPPFHFAYHVDDLMAARAFYGGLLGCAEGRSTETWVDFDFFGHQISLHFGVPFAIANTGKVGNHLVPMPHFGVVLPYVTWRALADRLEEAKTFFLLAPSVRFEGEAGEQWTIFFTTFWIICSIGMCIGRKRNGFSISFSNHLYLGNTFGF